MGAPLEQSRVVEHRKPREDAAVSVDLSMKGRPATFHETVELANIIERYQSRGHLLATLDPLKLARQNLDREKVLEIKIPEDKSVVYPLPKTTMIGNPGEKLPLGEIIDRLERAYCKTLTAEYNFVPSENKLKFLREKFEQRSKFELSRTEKIDNLVILGKSYLFETFITKKWPAERKFGLEGCDALVPAIHTLVEYGSEQGASSFVFDMTHRGRLNLLANIMKIPFVHVFSNFQPVKLSAKDQNTAGNVRYHLGGHTVVEHTHTKQKIRIASISNASHLGTVTAIAKGYAYGDSHFNEHKDQKKVWPIIIHGDAAISGQGVVYELFNLSDLENYNSGGTIHIITNNQIGFTTKSSNSRSTEYCTCIAKANDVPIIHVNSGDIEAVVYAIKVAVEYKAKFERDIVVDIKGYRLYGHNEVDEPFYTQPTMYSVIKKMEPVYLTYRKKCIDEKEDKNQLQVPKTGVSKDVLDVIGKAISTPPKDFDVHRGIQRVFHTRQKHLKEGIVDWALAEAFAFGSLLQEGVLVRLSGQDVERGTFSHRHHVIHDQTTGATRNMLHSMFPQQADYVVSNSPLSEYAVLGFEYGVSLTSPYALVMWEAQFGDFCNGAQVMIDQFLAGGESRWYRQSGIVMLLPHGMEGMGPEHSSARPERFLQICSDNDSQPTTDAARQMAAANWLLANPSTPANIFHLLRRQVKLNYRKPLVVFTPKSLLRHPQCVSSIQQFVGDTEFEAYIPDPLLKPDKSVSKLILCSGKVYYDLVAARKENNKDNEIAIARVEQIFPLPYEKITQDALENFPNASVLWVQEEHKNQGCWSFVAPRLNRVLGKFKGPITYVGRPPSCAPATGFSSVYNREKNNFINTAMSI
ncbi:2-oxoglutarate dehydrogenase, mitochondrial [Nilaparvata lugens]|uniref:2-oxoglutarate dehydrogenase, mitochondrial n=1 Tax=Nilaparvata lugens TaxID=108931 RepID=UPI00193DF0DF|nr:2-oxoglutarate dehydrogenase, mitochondrial [Nilaparvata lugens]